MYIVIGKTIVDSKEMKETIENNTDFKVVKDMSKGTKREDILAFNLSVDIKILDEIIKEEFNEDELDEEELFDEYLSLAEEMALELEEFISGEAILDAKAYKWDQSDNDIKLVIVVAHDELGDLKVRDIMKRLLTQVE